MTIRVGILTAPHINWIKTKDGFIIHDVRIGIGFHWDRTEDQSFHGQLEILHNDDGSETAVNIIELEDYLCSVISSEMNANAPMELLKAHAVISRSWAIRAIAANKHNTSSPLGTSQTFGTLTSYESNGHVGFDVCADDHCQRYEGTHRMNARAVEAVKATAGQVLTYDGQICDCRFHKCCGGLTEVFETCWEDVHIPYLESVECPWCGTAMRHLKEGIGANDIRDSLNDYDLETTDFHDWEVHYSSSELSTILAEKTGKDFGEIINLIPLHRGASGRIDQLKIVGTKRCEVIGKELSIRRSLSKTCLYSSWFDVKKTENGFTLSGHGWGHGVGLCQIGATQMALEGHSYQAILAHYYQHGILTTF